MRSTLRSSRAGLPQPRSERQAPTEGAGVPGSTGGQTDQTRWTVSSRRVHPLRGACRHLYEMTRGHIRPSDVYSAHRRCSSRRVWSLRPRRRRRPAPEADVLQHQTASEGTWHHQRDPPPCSRQSGNAVISQRCRAEAELDEGDSICSPFRKHGTVLFMNGSEGKRQSWRLLGGTHCPLVFRVGK